MINLVFQHLILFISSSCLISKAGASKNVTCGSDSEGACLVPDLNGNTSVSRPCDLFVDSV